MRIMRFSAGRAGGVVFCGWGEGMEWTACAEGGCMENGGLE